MNARTTETSHQISCLRMRSKDLNVIVWKTSGFQPRCHRLRGFGGITGRMGCIDLDQFLVNLTDEFLVRRQLSCLTIGLPRYRDNPEGTSRYQQEAALVEPEIVHSVYTGAFTGPLRRNTCLDLNESTIFATSF